MGATTEIQWTDATLNVVSGCTGGTVIDPASGKLVKSPACERCYAQRYARRGIGDFRGGRKFSEVRSHPERLEIMYRWKRPRKIFLCSTGDLFDAQVPDEFIWRVFAQFQYANWHTYQVLTKQPERMLRLVTEYIAEGKNLDSSTPFPFRNVWWGVTTENQATADERIPLLLQTPAAVRFVSVEPMLGPVEFAFLPNPGFGESQRWYDPLKRLAWYATNDESYYDICNCTEGLDWVICGGESGPEARPMNPDWVRSLRDQCRAAGVAFFFKSWGEWTDPWVTPEHVGHRMVRVGKKRAGRLLDGREWNEFPEARP